MTKILEPANRRVIRWKALFLALKGVWFVWAPAGFVGIPILAGLHAHQLARWIGMSFQLGGLSTVAFGVWRIRRTFHARGWFEDLLDAFRKFGGVVGPGKPTVIGAGTGDFVAVTGRARAQVVSTVPRGASLEDRVVALEENLKRLREICLRDVEQLEAVGDGLKRDVARLNNDLVATDAGVRALMREIAAGGLHIERVGLLWLAIGIVCTSVPGEVASALGVVGEDVRHFTARLTAWL